MPEVKSKSSRPSAVVTRAPRPETSTCSVRRLIPGKSLVWVAAGRGAAESVRATGAPGRAAESTRASAAPGRTAERGRATVRPLGRPRLARRARIVVRTCDLAFEELLSTRAPRAGFVRARGGAATSLRRVARDESATARGCAAALAGPRGTAHAPAKLMDRGSNATTRDRKSRLVRAAVREQSRPYSLAKVHNSLAHPSSHPSTTHALLRPVLRRRRKAPEDGSEPPRPPPVARLDAAEQTRPVAERVASQKAVVAQRVAAARGLDADRLVRRGPVARLAVVKRAPAVVVEEEPPVARPSKPSPLP
mmetsp:Transcript_4334/g.12734  ORF Transcript_4334/g.12734 Transcript_4334/m.12734 type:complete len:307 (-) Transcript_4334:14-934(-)